MSWKITLSCNAVLMNSMLFGLFKIYETTHSHNIGDITAYLDSNDVHNKFQFVNCHGELQFLKLWSNSDVMEECFHVSTLVMANFTEDNVNAIGEEDFNSRFTCQK